MRKLGASTALPGRHEWTCQNKIFHHRQVQIIFGDGDQDGDGKKGLVLGLFGGPSASACKKIDADTLQEWERLNKKSQTVPIRVWEHYGTPKRKLYYLFKENIYKPDREDYETEDAMHQILEVEEKEQRKLDRLKQKHSPKSESELNFKREGIREEVRMEVWRRDEGKCARCGSREKLEYDHIIPISKGGSNTARNIELLCEKCNREKSNRIQ